MIKVKGKFNTINVDHRDRASIIGLEPLSFQLREDIITENEQELYNNVLNNRYGLLWVTLNKPLTRLDTIYGSFNISDTKVTARLNGSDVEMLLPKHVNKSWNTICDKQSRASFTSNTLTTDKDFLNGVRGTIDNFYLLDFGRIDTVSHLIGDLDAYDF